MTWAWRPIVAEQRAHIFVLSDSTNIASGGTTNTTAQLTPPTGKTTGDFQAGRISDDTNPILNIDPNADKYLEFEFCLVPGNSTSNGQVYEFRLSRDGRPLDAYTVTPEWTIGTGAVGTSLLIRRRRMRHLVIR